MAREKADELAKPHLRDDADSYERDALFLHGLLASGSNPVD
jgi:hypothetical protein